MSSPGGAQRQLSLRDFMYEVGRELNRSPEQMEPVLAKLEDQWYDSVESLCQIQDWSSLGLPQRLVDVLRAKLQALPGRSSGGGGDSNAGKNFVDKSDALLQGELLSRGTSSGPSSGADGTVVAGGVTTGTSAASSSSSNVREGTNAKKSSPTWDIAPDQGAAPEAFQAVDLESVGTKLLQYQDGEALKTLIATLVKLIDAVLKNPDDESKRSINLGNDNFHKRVGRFSAAIEYLKGTGFAEADEQKTGAANPNPNHIVMRKAYISRLTDSRLILQRLIHHDARLRGMEIPPIPMKFNPFMSSVSATAGSSRSEEDTKRKTCNATFTGSLEAAALQEELAQKKKQLAALERPHESDDNACNFLLGQPRLCWTQDLGRLLKLNCFCFLSSLRDAIAEAAQLDGGTDEAADHDVIRDLFRGMQASGAGNFT
eukprot:g2019.t1